MTADWIEWPEGCDPEKHFPSEKGHLNVSDPRSVNHFWATVGGANLIRKALNISFQPRKKHTRESVETEIREFFAKAGKRPTRDDLPNLNGWLRKRGTSLAKLCDEMGLPGGKMFGRTRESVEAEIREFFAKTGERPTQNDLPKLQGWLRARGSSLPQLCDELGLPVARRGRHAK